MIHTPDHMRVPTANTVTTAEVISQLAAICGAGNVLTGDAAAPYGRDWRGQYPSQPMAVVRPATTAEVSAIVKIAAACKLAIIPQGGNTGLVGGTQTQGGLIVTLERMKRIRSIDAKGRSVAVDAGVILENLNTALAEHDLRFPVAIGAKGSAMIGGVLSTNAGGANVLAHGMSRAHCLGVEVVMPDGQILNDMGDLRKNNTGFDLKQLFVGAEGTLGIITGAVLALIDRPAAHATAMITTQTFDAGLTVLNRLRRAHGNIIEAFEVMPRSYFTQMARCGVAHTLPLAGDAAVTILVELASASPADCTPDEDGAIPLTAGLSGTLAACLEDGLIADAVIAQSDQQRQDMWRLRELAPELSIGRTPVVAADVCVCVTRIDGFVAAVRDVVSAVDPDALIWMVGHLGDGNLHVVVSPPNKTPAHLAQIRFVIDAVTVQHSGSFSAEHGIGVQKLSTMATHKDPVALELMRRVKDVFDPNGIMNPGKVLPETKPISNETKEEVS